MSTRAVYFFKDDDQQIAVYKHHDGYPTGAASFIEAARKIAWGGDRFEADEAAASFVAATKGGPGSVRLMAGHDWAACQGDIDYAYTITPGWKIEARETLSGFWDNPSAEHTSVIFEGTADAFVAWAEKAAA